MQIVGFVPTMGFLHDGHLDLIRASQSQCKSTIVSIFVNPTQFNDPSDFENYPMDLGGDLEKCKTAGVDLVFLPNKDEVYPAGGEKILMQFPGLQTNLCGRTRPGHFEGVLQIVSKLLHWTEPNTAFFGKKDYQQFRIIEALVSALSFPTSIVGIETKRDKDGLALSSRNARLGSAEREAASLIPRMYQMADQLLKDGERDIKTFRAILLEFLLVSSFIKLDYLEIVDPFSLQTKHNLEGNLLLAVAVFCGKTRLIDNREWMRS